MSSDHLRYVDGECSDNSNAVEYATGILTKLATPQNITLYPDGTAQWPAVEGADYYSVFVDISSNGDKYACNGTQTFVYGSVDENGVFSCSVKDCFDILYRGAGLYNGEAARFWIRAQAMSSDHLRYVDGECSDNSNVVEYALRKQVESLTLSPAAPVVCKGNSYYLGKTIQPEDAYYTSIDWQTSDASIVAVDAAGRIQGISAGSAELTAAIGDATDTVTVSVYEISSNIENPEDKENVTDAAGDIIDDIANNENPNLDNTDIAEEDREDIRQDIQEGVWRGDAFFTDIKWYEEQFGKYKNNWGQIQKAARELNAQFAGAYNIEVEMYHKDDAGTDYHIGNIVQLENEVTFTFDLPTGMAEIQSGYARKYVLVRIHQNTIEAIDMQVEGDRFTVQSDCFSDFVLLYVDTPTDEIDLTAFRRLVLPSGICTIDAEAFADTAAEVIIVPESCERIESQAFANCTNLKYIVLPPNSEITIAEDAFEGSDAIILYR